MIRKSVTFWLNLGAFITGGCMMGGGLLAAYAQQSLPPMETSQAAAKTVPQSPVETVPPPAAVGASAAAPPKSEVRPVIMSVPVHPQPLDTPRAVAPSQAQRPPAKPVRQLIALPKVTMYPGDVRVLRLPKVARIAVGNGNLLKTTIVDDKQIVLVAEDAGDTSVHLWYVGGQEARFDVQVQASNTASLLNEVKGLIKGFPTIQASVSGQSVVLSGSYPNKDAASKVKEVLKRAPSVVNLIPDDPLETNTVHPEPMIYLDLRVVEIRKSSLDQLGIRWNSTAQGPTFAAAANIYSNARFPNAANSGFPVVNSNRPVVGYLGLATQVTSMLNFLEQNGDSWTLAEPRLSCQSGGQSEFLAGGEIPIPISTGLGQVDVTYKKYGVVIKFEPKVDLKDNISSKIYVEVSQPDQSNAVNGFMAFTSNSTQTEVALRPNVPLVISGLLRMQSAKTVQGVPGISRLPVIGGLFKDREGRSEQTELLIVVTPRVIRPDRVEDRAGVDRAQLQAEQIKKSVFTRLAD